MNAETMLFIGFAFGIGVMILGGLGFQSWKDGGRLEGKLKSVEKENKDRLDNAKRDKSRGRRKRFSALLFFFLASGLFVAFLLLVGDM